MYSTTVYLYQQITPVLLVDTSGGYFTRRYDPVYAKSLTINKAVDNVLLFEFINQDQKPVNITGSSFVFRLIDQAGNGVLLEKDMEILSAATGRVKVTLTNKDTINLTAQPASYSIQRTAGNYVQAAYVDDNAGARGTAVIVDSIQPQHVPSRELTIPDIYGNPTEFFPPQLAEYFSSEVEAPGYLTTFQMYLDTYTGTIKFQGQNFQGIEWTDASISYEYVAESAWHYFTVTGHYSRLRIAFDNRQGQGATATATVSTEGVVTGISVTAQGTDYQGAARITIVGNGSGAQATSTVNGNGGVGSITVTAGGAGYTPLQIQNTVRANVIIDAGAVTSISYR
jgi:hypothetical protein